MDTWTKPAADQANEAVKKLGIVRPNMVKNFGYCSPPLDGIWMRAPYLHNGSVPTLNDLLKPVSSRPEYFYRGYDVYDPVHVGFISQGPDAMRTGWKQNVKERGNGNQGHTYGTQLTEGEKTALLEYMKTL